MTTAPLAGAPPVPGASPADLRKLNAVVAGFYRTDIAKSFEWPFYAAALSALIAVVPALLTGRRLGEHAGHHEMTREQRLAALGRAEAAEAGEPLVDPEAWADRADGDPPPAGAPDGAGGAGKAPPADGPVTDDGR